MGLYLCLFDGDEEIDAVEVGPYSKFERLRELIVGHLEDGQRGSRYPTLMDHSESDGQWSPGDLEALAVELADICSRSTEESGIRQITDADDGPVIDALARLVQLARDWELPILFQ